MLLGARAPEQEAAIYLLPAVTGLLLDLLLRMMMITIEEGRQVLLYKRYPVSYFAIPVIAIVLMLAIVFSFQSCQEMAAIQRAGRENRAGKPDDTDAGFYRRNGADVSHNAFCQA